MWYNVQQKENYFSNFPKPIIILEKEVIGKFIFIGIMNVRERYIHLKKKNHLQINWRLRERCWNKMADLANQGEVNEWTRDQSSVDRGAACTDTSNQQGEWSEQKTRNRHPPETQKEWGNLLSSEMLISLWIVTSIPRGTLHKMSKDLLSDGLKKNQHLPSERLLMPLFVIS